jgi:hypothetical protein
MTLKNQNNLFQKIVILLLATSFTLFGMQESKNIFHHRMSVKQAQDNVSTERDSCCQNCSDENCSCCTHHKENKTNNSKGCSCQVSKDMDDRPSSIPESFKLNDYHFFQINLDFPTESILKHLSQSNLNSSEVYYNSFKAETSTVLRI